jgi:hypothetical protein
MYARRVRIGWAIVTKGGIGLAMLDTDRGQCVRWKEDLSRIGSFDELRTLVGSKDSDSFQANRDAFSSSLRFMIKRAGVNSLAVCRSILFSRLGISVLQRSIESVSGRPDCTVAFVHIV